MDADAAQLERAFANLLENAVRYGDGRPVTVRSRQVGERVVVRVVDQGPGIPEPELKQIFEPFRRGARLGRSGLGLAIAKGFVEANDGEIAVESVPGQGTSVVVSFRRRAGVRGDERAAAPRPGLRRRAADPARAAGDPARGRLRGGER